MRTDPINHLRVQTKLLVYSVRWRLWWAQINYWFDISAPLFLVAFIAVPVLYVFLFPVHSEWVVFGPAVAVACMGAGNILTIHKYKKWSQRAYYLAEYIPSVAKENNITIDDGVSRLVETFGSNDLVGIHRALEIYDEEMSK